MNNIDYKVRVVLLVLAALTISACSTLKSSVDVADNAEFTELRTYAWITNETLLKSSSDAPEVVNPLNEQRIRAAAEQELKRKGYKMAPIAEADFVVGFTLGTHNRVRIQRYYDNLGYRYYGFYRGFGRLSRYSPGYDGFGSGVSVRTFTEGTLVVDIFENTRKEAIWHGSASKRLSGSKATRELIDEAVATLLAEFPDRGMISDAMKAAHINADVVSNR